MKAFPLTLLLTAGALTHSSATTTILVKFEALGPVAFAPVAGVFHDGSFDFFNAGSAASTVVETIAEFGETGPLLGSVPAGANAGIVGGGMTLPAGNGAASTGCSYFNVSGTNGFFSFGAMLLPSNDWFIGNDFSFDASSLLSAVAGSSLTFDVGVVWDARTEIEDFDYSRGNELFGNNLPNWPTTFNNSTTEGASQSQTGVITAVTGPNPYAVFASNVGQNHTTPYNVSLLDFTGGPVGRFTLTVVPEPSTALLAGLGGLFLIRRRR